MIINENYKIESDTLNFTLYQKTRSRRIGKEYWAVKGYYSSAKNALKALVDKEIMGDGFKDLESVVKKIDELKTTIDQLPTLSQNPPSPHTAK